MNPNQLIRLLAVLIAVFALSLSSARAALPPEALNSWRTVESSTTNTLNAVLHTNGLFVAVGSRGAVVTSPDGVNWTPRVSGVTNHLRAITHEQGRWVAGGDSVILQSPDAVNWTNAPITGLPVGGRIFLSVRFGNGRFAALASSGVATSSNGVAWTYQERANPALEAMTFGAGRFIAVRGDFITGSEIFSSTNGVDWLLVTNYGSFLNLNGVTYTGGKFFATGANGYLVTSDDGLVWNSTIAAPTCGVDCQNIWDVVSGDGAYLLVASQGFRVFETAGNFWPQVSPVPCFSQALAYGAGQFVAVGGSGCISIPANVYWTNTLGGAWNDAANWRPNRVPGTGDNAFVKENGTYGIGPGGGASNIYFGAETGTQTLGTSLFELFVEGQAVFGSNAVFDLGLGMSGGGNVGGGGNVTMHGRMNWGSGSVSYPSTVTIAPNGLLNMDGIFSRFVGGWLTNHGHATWSGTGGMSVGFLAGIQNMPGATFEIENDQAIFAADPSFSPVRLVHNAGLFRKSGGNGTTTIAIPFVNTGTVEVQSGTLDFASSIQQRAGSLLLKGGNVDASGANQLKIDGGLLGGGGKILKSLTVSGQLSPGLSAGRLEILGNYQQAFRGSYNVEIGGTIPGTNYDQVVVASNATLAGVINICSINGFVPAPGDRFEIMTFASKSGSVTFQGLDIANGIHLQPIISATNIVLVATNAPLSVSPKLNLARNGDDLWLWWPLGYGDFTAQMTTSLNPPINWLPVSLTETSRSIFTPTGPTKFFRMVGP